MVDRVVASSRSIDTMPTLAASIKNTPPIVVMVMSHQQRCDEEENISGDVAQVLGQKHADVDNLKRTQSNLSNLTEKQTQRLEQEDKLNVCNKVL